MENYYVGVDLHRDFFVVNAQKENGYELFKERYVNSEESIVNLLSHFNKPPKVVVEATRNWMWFTASLMKHGCKVQLAHPFRVKAIAAARVKTDSIDAKTLCDLLRANLIPQAYIATLSELDNRELSRGRVSLVHDQTILKNRIMAILGKENLKFEGKDTFGKKGLEWLKEQKLSSAKRQMVNIYLERLTNVRKAIEEVEELIKQKSSGFPEVKLLQTIAGLGTTTAFILASEIGNVKRFPSAKKFASYFGLVPRLSQSGNHAYYGRITKLGNPYVRWVLVQAAHRLARTDDKYKHFVDRLSYRTGKKKAIVALARKLSAIVYCILKEERGYLKERPTRSPKACPAIIPESVYI